MKKHLLLVASATLCLAFLWAAAPRAAEKAKPSPKEIQEQYDLAFEAALTRYEKANLLYKKGDLDGAVDQLLAITKIKFPEEKQDSDGVRMQLDAFTFLAELYLEKEDPKSALETIKAALKIAPDISHETYQLYMTLGHIYKTMKKNDDALAAFDKAQKINDTLRKKEKKDSDTKK